MYPTNQYMMKYIKTIVPNCRFCKDHPGTISGLLEGWLELSCHQEILEGMQQL